MTKENSSAAVGRFPLFQAITIDANADGKVDSIAKADNTRNLVMEVTGSQLQQPETNKEN